MAEIFIDGKDIEITGLDEIPAGTQPGATRRIDLESVDGEALIIQISEAYGIPRQIVIEGLQKEPMEL
jgi:hypothetical protein